MVSALLMISLAACPTDGFDDVDQIAVVVANPPAGAAAVGQEIELTCATPGVFIYYTLDSSPPSINSPLYTDAAKPVLATLPATIKAIALKSDMADSPVLEAAYYTGGTVATPTASPGAGEVISGQSITLSCGVPDATIYYTIDGSTPSSTNGTQYTAASNLTTFVGTLKAIAVKDNMEPSAVLEVTYTLYVAPSWTADAVANFYNDWASCVASNGGDTFVGGGFSSVLSYSSDGGSSWTYGTYPLFALGETPLSIQSIAYGNNTFVAVGVYGNIAYASSSNLASWTKVTTTNFLPLEDPAYGAINGVAYGNGKFVAVGVGGNMAYAMETDLQTWTPVDNSTSTFGASDIQAITYGEGKFIAASTDGKMAWSDNGTIWTAVTDSTFGGTAIFGIAWGEDIFVAVGAGGKMAWSDDGLIWNAISTTFASKDINGICHGNGQFIAVAGNRTVGLDGAIAGSPDGKTWAAVIDTPSVNAFNVTLYGVAYGNGRFVAGGSYAVIAHTTP
jgi:hypothetical protein